MLDHNNNTQLLPAAVEAAYRPQAAQYFMKDYATNDYPDVKFEPLVKFEPKQNVEPSSQPVEIKLTLDVANGWRAVASKI